MQEYNRIEDTEYISDAPSQLNKNMESIATDFSGASFPTKNLFVGMKCLRTDENKIYRLYENASNQLVWQLEYTIVDGGIKVKQADGASSATKATNDANDKAITSYVAGVAAGSAQGKIKVTDGAGKSTEFTSYTIATQSEAEVGTDNTKSMTPTRTKNAIDKQRPIKTFTSLKQLGLDNNATWEEIANSLPSYSMIIFYVSIVSTETTNYYPNLYAESGGLLSIIKGYDAITPLRIHLNSIVEGINYVAKFTSYQNMGFSGWQVFLTDAPSVSNQRNGYYRGKNLGTIASVADADAFNTAHGLSAGTFNDIFVGDEITIKDGTYNAVWLVAGVDWDYNKGDTASGHGILLIPKAPLYNDQMNSTNVTTGGYKGSAMHTTKLPALVTKLQTALGSHLKKRRVLISNSVNTSIASMAGEGWTGASNGWEWVDTYAVLPSEVEVYGSTVFSSSFRDVGEACQKLPIFNFINPVYFSRWDFWLRAVASSTTFCVVYGDGHASYGYASNSRGVRPLIYLA